MRQVEPISRIRIGMLEAEPMRALGVRSIFEQSPYIDVVVTDLQHLLSDSDFTIALLTLSSATNVFETMGVIRSTRPDLRQIVLGPAGDEELILQALSAGAKGYLEDTTTPDLVIQAVEVVLEGSIWAPRRVLATVIEHLLRDSDRTRPGKQLQLTPREREVLRLLLAARSNREIADTLGIEERTVKGHVQRLMKKTGAENRISLSMRAVSHRLVPPSGGPD